MKISSNRNYRIAVFCIAATIVIVYTVNYHGVPDVQKGRSPSVVPILENENASSSSRQSKCNEDALDDSLSLSPYRSLILKICGIHDLEPIINPSATVPPEELNRELEIIRAEAVLARRIVSDYNEKRDKWDSDPLNNASPVRIFQSDGFEWAFRRKDDCGVTGVARRFEFHKGRLCCSKKHVSEVDTVYFYFLEGCDATISVHCLPDFVTITAVEDESTVFCSKFRRIPETMIVKPAKESVVDLSCPNEKS